MYKDEKNVVIAFLLVLLTKSSLAAWTGKYPIRSVKATNVGVEVILSEFTNSITEEPCTHSSFVIAEGTSNFETKISFVLAAYMAKKLTLVSITVGQMVI